MADDNVTCERLQYFLRFGGCHGHQQLRLAAGQHMSPRLRGLIERCSFARLNIHAR